MKYTMLAVVLATVAMIFAGCGEKTTGMSNDEIRASMVGDLWSTYETGEEGKNRFTHTSIINGRRINGDIMRFMLLDRPSRDVSAPSIIEFK